MSGKTIGPARGMMIARSAAIDTFHQKSSDDLSVIVERQETSRYSVLYSPPSAEHEPDYQEFADVSNEGIAMLLAEIAVPMTERGNVVHFGNSGDLADEK